MKSCLVIIFVLFLWNYSSAQVIDTTSKSYFTSLGIIHNESNEKELIVSYNKFISPEHAWIKQDYFKGRTLVLKDDGLLPKWNNGFYFISELKNHHRFIRANSLNNWDYGYFPEPTDPWIYFINGRELVQFYFPYEWVERHPLSTEIIEHGSTVFSDYEAVFLIDNKYNRLLITLKYTATYDFTTIDSVLNHSEFYDVLYIDSRKPREVANYFSDSTVIAHKIIAILDGEKRQYLAKNRKMISVLDSTFHVERELGEIDDYSNSVHFSKDSMAVLIGERIVYERKKDEVNFLPFDFIRDVAFSDTSASTLFFVANDWRNSKSALYKSTDLGKTATRIDTVNFNILDIESYKGDVYGLSSQMLLRYRSDLKDTLGIILSTETENALNVDTSFELKPAFPNPFNPSTTVTFTLDTRADIVLEVYSILGQKITTLLNESRSSGLHTIRWDASNYSSGVYFIRLISNTSPTVFVQKVTLLK